MRRNAKGLAVMIGAFVAFAGTATAGPCIVDKTNPMQGFAPLDSNAFLDLPDPIAVRATAVIENHFVAQLINESTRQVSKVWCDIGVTRLIIDFELPVEDDAVKAVLTRAVFNWDTSTDVAGWQIHALGERGICARGDNPLAPICP